MILGPVQTVRHLALCLYMFYTKQGNMICFQVATLLGDSKLSTLDINLTQLNALLCVTIKGTNKNVYNTH